MSPENLDNFPFGEPLPQPTNEDEKAQQKKRTDAMNALELGNPSKPVKDLPFKAAKDRPPTPEEREAFEQALEGAAERGVQIQITALEEKLSALEQQGFSPNVALKSEQSKLQAQVNELKTNLERNPNGASEAVLT